MLQTIRHYGAAKSYLTVEAVVYRLLGKKSVERGGEVFKFFTDSITASYELCFINLHEKELRAELEEVVGNEDVFYDVGANIGYHSIVSGRYAGKIIAFEPRKPTFDELERNIELNNSENIQAVQIAASNSCGFVSMKKAFGRALGQAQIADRNGDIEAKRIDSLVRKKDFESPDVVKIDVEGHEPEVLEGMKETLEDSKPLLYIETHGNRPNIEEILHSKGYEVEVLDRRKDGIHLKAW